MPAQGKRIPPSSGMSDALGKRQPYLANALKGQNKIGPFGDWLLMQNLLIDIPG